MKNNEIWRVSPGWLMAYTEDKETTQKIQRSYQDFIRVAEYAKDGEIIGIQFKIPSARKRSAIHLLGVNVSK
ncbi:hypothetical protein SC499_20235 [Peribacillus simplex]|uniref:hypothetical protein n=1 Tax=Peribacillus simplex TaxID=1478 RepID=UPI00298DB306|nr:hypothetical protein [Peribacillus simplex]MDW7616979.1 hypothetical protein [Peribacillus simplex]